MRYLRYMFQETTSFEDALAVADSLYDRGLIGDFEFNPKGDRGYEIEFSIPESLDDSDVLNLGSVLGLKESHQVSPIRKFNEMRKAQ